MVTDPRGSCYAPIVFPAGNRLQSTALPTGWLSGWEEILQCWSNYQFYAWLPKDFRALGYPQDISEGGNSSRSFVLNINSVSTCDPIWEYCATHQLSLQPGTDSPPSRYPQLPFWLERKCLSAQEQHLQYVCTPEFCFLLGTYCGVLHYPTGLSHAGNRSCSVTLPINAASNSCTTL